MWSVRVRVKQRGKTENHTVQADPSQPLAQLVLSIHSVVGIASRRKIALAHGYPPQLITVNESTLSSPLRDSGLENSDTINVQFPVEANAASAAVAAAAASPAIQSRGKGKAKGTTKATAAASFVSARTTSSGVTTIHPISGSTSAITRSSKPRSKAAWSRLGGGNTLASTDMDTTASSSASTSVSHKDALLASIERNESVQASMDTALLQAAMSMCGGDGGRNNIEEDPLVGFFRTNLKQKIAEKYEDSLATSRYKAALGGLFKFSDKFGQGERLGDGDTRDSGTRSKSNSRNNSKNSSTISAKSNEGADAAGNRITGASIATSPSTSTRRSSRIRSKMNSTISSTSSEGAIAGGDAIIGAATANGTGSRTRIAGSVSTNSSTINSKVDSTTSSTPTTSLFLRTMVVDFKKEVGGWTKEEFQLIPEGLLRATVIALAKDSDEENNSSGTDSNITRRPRDCLRPYEMSKSPRVFWSLVHLYGGDVRVGLSLLLPDEDWSDLDSRKRGLSEKAVRNIDQQEIMSRRNEHNNDDTSNNNSTTKNKRCKTEVEEEGEIEEHACVVADIVEEDEGAEEWLLKTYQVSNLDQLANLDIDNLQDTSTSETSTEVAAWQESLACWVTEARMESIEAHLRMIVPDAASRAVLKDACNIENMHYLAGMIIPGRTPFVVEQFKKHYAAAAAASKSSTSENTSKSKKSKSCSKQPNNVVDEACVRAWAAEARKLIVQYKWMRGIDI